MLNKKLCQEAIRYCYRYFKGIARWQQINDNYLNVVTNDDEEREFFMEKDDDGKSYIIGRIETGVDVITGDRQYRDSLVWQQGS